MTMTRPASHLRIARDTGRAEAALDGALLKQTGLLATLITTRRATASEPFLGQSELMRLVKSQQTLLSGITDRTGLNDSGELFMRKAA